MDYEFVTLPDLTYRIAINSKGSYGPHTTKRLTLPYP